MRALLPISHSSEWQVEPRRKLFLRRIQPWAQRPYGRHAARARAAPRSRAQHPGQKQRPDDALRRSWRRRGANLSLAAYFGLSLDLVILPFFVWLRSSGGYDANAVASHRIGDEEHSTVYQSDDVKAHLASGAEVIELDHVRIQEHFCSRSKVDAVHPASLEVDHAHDHWQYRRRRGGWRRAPRRR